MSRLMNLKMSEDVGKMTDGELRIELKAIAEYIDLITEELNICAMQNAE